MSPTATAGAGPVPAALPGPGPDLSPEQRLDRALSALASSRDALRRELLPPPDTGAGAASGGLPRPWRQAWHRLRRRLRQWPLGQLATDSLQRWWQHQPWHGTAGLLADSARSGLVPQVRRHPVAAVALAAGLGALLVAGRPWRWPLVGDHLRPLPARAGQWLLRQLGSVPVQTALASLLLGALRSAPAAESAAGPASAQSAEPSGASDAL